MVSVCVATYNGAAYVEHQLRSILEELHQGDEVVVVDDASSDETVEIVRAIADPRVRVITLAANGGYVRAFESSLRAARGDVLFLSDQDDEWVPGRRAALLKALELGAVAASNIEMLGTGEPLRSPITRRPWRLREGRGGPVRNEVAILAGVAPYYGCGMALDRRALDYVLPFPADLTESHDLWIATMANARGELVHTDVVTVRRRVHDSNASSSRPRGLGPAFRSRALLYRLWREARRRR